ncbi:hypothetical protein SS50377_27255 [Spironucleus salmonicida]|uniref:Uncharacterized protein n=1 Tax=Spironucleus salmonicida TaxID=348837 RepID=V6LIA8_9EUKA|nr:hypothetical protein SS50377_27255 [Spironucleus salmonicida]|eukprot:EST44315.1 Hypothetical protein SS50377_15852 [Spironucleus salmonicida]
MQSLQWQLKSIEEAELIADAISSQFQPKESDILQKKIINENTTTSLHLDNNFSLKMDIQDVRIQLEAQFGIQNNEIVYEVPAKNLLKMQLKRSKKLQKFVLGAVGLGSGLLGLLGYLLK